nr:hypothetical protein [Okeania sp. SIO2F4]
MVVPPRHYCVVANPVLRNSAGQLVADNYGQIRFKYGDREIRFAQDPFPLCPGEILEEDVTQLQVVETNQALASKQYEILPTQSLLMENLKPSFVLQGMNGYLRGRELTPQG